MGGLFRIQVALGSIPRTSTTRPFPILSVRTQARRYLPGEGRTWGADHLVVIAILHVACGRCDSDASYFCGHAIRGR